MRINSNITLGSVCVRERATLSSLRLLIWKMNALLRTSRHVTGLSSLFSRLSLSTSLFPFHDAPDLRPPRPFLHSVKWINIPYQFTLLPLLSLSLSPLHTSQGTLWGLQVHFILSSLAMWLPFIVNHQISCIKRRHFMLFPPLFSSSSSCIGSIWPESTLFIHCLTDFFLSHRLQQINLHWKCFSSLSVCLSLFLFAWPSSFFSLDTRQEKKNRTVAAELLYFVLLRCSHFRTYQL